MSDKAEKSSYWLVRREERHPIVRQINQGQTLKAGDSKSRNFHLIKEWKRSGIILLASKSESREVQSLDRCHSNERTLSNRATEKSRTGHAQGWSCRLVKQLAEILNRSMSDRAKANSFKLLATGTRQHRRRSSFIPKMTSFREKFIPKTTFRAKETSGWDSANEKEAWEQETKERKCLNRLCW